MLGRPHGPERERVAAGVAASRLLHVIGELEADRDGQIEISERAAAASAPRRMGSKSTAADSGRNELPIHRGSASWPVFFFFFFFFFYGRLAGPSAAM